jgi:hypothetical protein
LHGELTLFGDTPAQKRDQWLRDVFSAYRSAGGSLKDGKAAAILGAAAKRARYSGATPEQVQEAAKQLGRSHGHPGALGAVARRLMADTACRNGDSRSRLTVEQLSRCGCAQCREWARVRAGEPL